MIQAQDRVIRIRSGETTLLKGLHLHELTDDQRQRLRRLVRVVDDTPEGMRVRGGARRVGRTRVADLDLSVLPPFDARSLLRFIELAGGIGVDAIRPGSPVIRISADTAPLDVLLLPTAAAMVEESEDILRRHVARPHTRREERSLLLRGRPLWSKAFGQHPASGLPCETWIAESDNRLNRLILAGLSRAVSTLRGTGLETRAENQVFIWRDIASTISVTPTDFVEAAASLNRMTQHYGAPLWRSRLLCFGESPSDLFSSGTTPLGIHLEFDFARLFERAVGQLLSGACEMLGLSVEIRTRDRRALKFPDGTVYREVEPDFVLKRDGNPVAVADAKFKPRYVGGLGGITEKVTNADIYQILFYRSTLAAPSLGSSTRALIVAPRLVPSRGSASGTEQVIVWKDDIEGEQRIAVIAVELEPLLSPEAGPLTPESALKAFPGLKDELAP